MRRGLRVVKWEVRGLAFGFLLLWAKNGRNSSCSPAARRRREPDDRCVKLNCAAIPPVSWKANYSVMSAGHSQALARRLRAAFNSQTMERYFSTRSAICP